MTRDTWYPTCDTWHVTHDMWHVTSDTWHLTCDTWLVVNILSKFQLPCSYGLGFMMSWRFGGKRSLTQSVNELIKRLFVEYPPATPGLLNTLLLSLHLRKKKFTVTMDVTFDETTKLLNQKVLKLQHF